MNRWQRAEKETPKAISAGAEPVFSITTPPRSCWPGLRFGPLTIARPPLEFSIRSAPSASRSSSAGPAGSDGPRATARTASTSPISATQRVNRAEALGCVALIRR